MVNFPINTLVAPPLHVYDDVHRASLIRGLTQGDFSTFANGGALLQALLGDFDGQQTVHERPFSKLDRDLRDMAQGTARFGDE